MVTQGRLAREGFSCNVNELELEITYFGSSKKVYSCADHPKKPPKKLIEFVKSIGLQCYNERRYNFFWNKYFWHLKYY